MSKSDIRYTKKEKQLILIVNLNFISNSFTSKVTVIGLNLIKSVSFYGKKNPIFN